MSIPNTRFRVNPVQGSRSDTWEQAGRQDKKTDGQTKGGYVQTNRRFTCLCHRA